MPSSKRGREDSSRDVTQAKRQKQKPVYGNYHFYYSYRIGQVLDEDPRLKLFRKEWFENKDCLDIGCNEGYVTITIAQKFGCKSMLDVDIDNSLISVAYRHLHKECGQETEVAEGNSGAAGGRSGLAEVELLRKCHKVDSFELGRCRPFEVFCKDELRPGGMLVLEPQPWTSYKRKSQFSEVARRNYKEAALRPEQFQQVLTEKIGFKSCEEVTSAVPNSTTAEVMLEGRLASRNWYQSMEF